TLSKIANAMHLGYGYAQNGEPYFYCFVDTVCNGDENEKFNEYQYNDAMKGNHNSNIHIPVVKLEPEITIAAHFDGDEYTEEELDEIIKKLKTSSKAEEGLAILKQLTDDLPGHAEQMISYGKSLLESIDKLNDEGQQKVK